MVIAYGFVCSQLRVSKSMSELSSDYPQLTQIHRCGSQPAYQVETLDTVYGLTIKHLEPHISQVTRPRVPAPATTYGQRITVLAGDALGIDLQVPRQHGPAVVCKAELQVHLGRPPLPVERVAVRFERVAIEDLRAVLVAQADGRPVTSGQEARFLRPRWCLVLLALHQGRIRRIEWGGADRD